MSREYEYPERADGGPLVDWVAAWSGAAEIIRHPDAHSAHVVAVARALVHIMTRGPRSLAVLDEHLGPVWRGRKAIPSDLGVKRVINSSGQVTLTEGD